MTEVSFFSRDDRTFRLFRSSWQIAAREHSLGAKVFNRGFGLQNTWRAIRNFVANKRTRRVVFGTSEICLYALFANEKDVFVFTGLGRLLLDDGAVARSVRLFLRWTFTEQTVVVLNPQDQQLIGSLLGIKPTLIDGEGYPFDASLPILVPRVGSVSPVFAYVGRLLKSKGVDTLIGEFSHNSLSGWTLLVIGDGDFSNRDSLDPAELQRLALESAGKIEYMGFRKDVRKILKGVDFLISMSRREGLPFSVLDGIDGGAHLILSPVPGHLSFKDVAGVTFVESDQLGQIFKEIASDPIKFLNFDHIARRQSCDRRFGQATIVEAIKRLLVKPTGANGLGLPKRYPE